MIVNALKIRLGIEMQTRTGLRRMVGTPYTTDEADLFIESAAMGVVSYPDQRVTKLLIYVTEVTNDVDGLWYVAELEAKKSLYNDLVYAVFGNLVGIRYGLTWASFKVLYPQVSAAVVDGLPAAIIDGDPNLVLVSEQYQPRMIYGRSALPVGNDADDQILAFESAAVPVSDGQFGEFPVIAFCRRSISALKVGTTTAFAQVAPITVNRGVIGRFGVVNIGGTIFYLSSDGIYKMGDEQPLSSLIQNSQHPHDLLRNINTESALAYFVDGRTGRRELWVSTSSRIYCMSLSSRQWFTIDETRKRLMFAYGGLWGIDQDGLKNEAGGDTTGARIGMIQPAPIHLGQPEVMKRWRKVIIRYPSRDVVAFTQQSDYEITLQFYGVTDLILSIDVMVELRYAHRVRMRRDNRVAVSIFAGSQNLLNDKLVALQQNVDSLNERLAATVTDVSNRITAIEHPIDTNPKGIETDVPSGGRTVEFPMPFADQDAYIPYVMGFSADMTRNVTVGMSLTAYGMTFYPAEDGATIYWKAEGL